jgi:hypothetical protein
MSPISHILKYRFEVILHPDNGILEPAVATGFDYRGNGDKHLLKVGHDRGFKHVQPTEFIDLQAPHGRGRQAARI